MAISRKYSKNLQRVQDMLNGNNQGKIQSGYTGEVQKKREIGDIWTDSDGVQWEQKNGYKSKITKINVGIFTHQCSDCKKACTKSFDVDTWKRMGRCYHCQMDFELMLKTKKIGKNGNKWQFWVRLHELQNWISGRNELESYIYRQHEERKNTYDESIVNALSNANIKDAMEVNKRMINN
jgi:hypothetical protein